MKSVKGLSDNSCQNVLPFPKLRINHYSGNVGLFSSKNRGVYVHVIPGKLFCLGDECTQGVDWEDYSGNVCLTNGE